MGHQYIIVYIYIWASPCEKSKEEGQRQKVKLFSLNMKESKATRHNSTFVASLFLRLGTFSVLLGMSKCIFFKNCFSKIYLIPLEKLIVTKTRYFC